MKIWYFWGLEELKFVILEIPKVKIFEFLLPQVEAIKKIKK